ITYPPPCRYRMTRSGVAPGAAIHSALTPLALTFSQITSAGRRSLIRSIPARRFSIDALGFCGCDLIRSITLLSCSLAIFPPVRCAGYSDGYITKWWKTVCALLEKLARCLHAARCDRKTHVLEDRRAGAYE